MAWFAAGATLIAVWRLGNKARDGWYWQLVSALLWFTAAAVANIPALALLNWVLGALAIRGLMLHDTVSDETDT
jgi:hypothetical protein